MFKIHSAPQIGDIIIFAGIFLDWPDKNGKCRLFQSPKILWNETNRNRDKIKTKSNAVVIEGIPIKIITIDDRAYGFRFKVLKYKARIARHNPFAFLQVEYQENQKMGETDCFFEIGYLN